MTLLQICIVYIKESVALGSFRCATALSGMLQCNRTITVHYFKNCLKQSGSLLLFFPYNDGFTLLHLFHDFSHLIFASLPVTSMICNGGKQGCTMKGFVAVDATWQAVGVAMQDVFIYNVHGINGTTPEETMRNMGRIASPGMVAPKRPLRTFSETKRWSKEKKPYG